ncbi:hypothetical protein CRENBAI_023914 [Crenichthys baileyi]|uniref:Uncharacterized protein n=1 Tax=Crenichthys baileyi TaxID=28760 RepID=A0AAV9SJY3_9TELE
MALRMQPSGFHWGEEGSQVVMGETQNCHTCLKSASLIGVSPAQKTPADLSRERGGQLLSDASKSEDESAKGLDASCGSGFKTSSVASFCCQLSDNMHEQTLGGSRWKDEARGEDGRKQDKIDTLKGAKWPKSLPHSPTPAGFSRYHADDATPLALPGRCVMNALMSIYPPSLFCTISDGASSPSNGAEFLEERERGAEYKGVEREIGTGCG